MNKSKSSRKNSETKNKTTTRTLTSKHLRRSPKKVKIFKAQTTRTLLTNPLPFEENRSLMDIQEEVEALRSKLHSSKEHSLVYALLQREEKRLRDYKRTLKLAMSVRK